MWRALRLAYACPRNGAAGARERPTQPCYRWSAAPCALVRAPPEQVARYALNDLSVMIVAPESPPSLSAAVALSQHRGGGVLYRAGGAGECRQARPRHHARHSALAHG